MSIFLSLSSKSFIVNCVIIIHCALPLSFPLYVHRYLNTRTLKGYLIQRLRAVLSLFFFLLSSFEVGVIFYS